VEPTTQWIQTVSGRFSVQIGSANGSAGWIGALRPMQTASNSELTIKFKIHPISPPILYSSEPEVLLPPTYPIFQPTSEPETALNNLLKSAQLRDESAIQCTEDPKLNYLSVEDIASRRTELCPMQELIFRAEVNVKRAATIKRRRTDRSKTRRSRSSRWIHSMGKGEGKSG
jgi:hypothetical protein